MTRATRRMQASPLARSKYVVVAAEVVDIEERQADLVTVALRRRTVALEQFLQVGARVQPRQAVLARPGRQPGHRDLLGTAQALAGIAVVADPLHQLPPASRTGWIRTSFQTACRPAGSCAA